MLAVIVTHGWRKAGHDPAHTHEGLILLHKMLSSIIPFLCYPESRHFNSRVNPECLVKKIVVGSGWRFQEMYRAAADLFPQDIPVEYTLFCGAQDSTVIRAQKETCVYIGKKVRVPRQQYKSVADTKSFNSWAFLSEYPNMSVFFSGKQFMAALGVESKSASIYIADTRTKEIVCYVAEGKRLKTPVCAKA